MPRLVFDFPDPAGATGPRPPTRAVFRDPVEIVAAHHIDDVRTAVRRVQDAVADGLHAAGYISYEAAPAFEPAMAVRPGHRLPLVWFGIFRGPEALDPPAPTGGDVVAPENPDWTPEWSRADYDAAFTAVREAIAAGRTYQVNLTTRLRATLDADPWAFHERMRRSQGRGYHAYLDLGRHVILSASPELFFRTRGREIVTRPMKGTRPRGRWPDEDRALQAALTSSEKDRSENLMIVDLLRNDLGRVCETGSVRAAALHEIERYRTVWQMTSTVRGRLRDDADLLDQLDALFPCGSVTGAPKISTMREIARLEPSPREVYCGAIGWVRPGGDATFSVPIRTAWLDRDTRRLEFGTGGGVVWDSTPDEEYAELRAKSVVVRDPWPELALLETLALRDGRYTRRDRHLARMRASAVYFGFPFPDDDIHDALTNLATRHPHGDFLARLILAPDGAVSTHARPLGASDPSDDALPRVRTAARPIDSRNPLLYHKTTHREPYDARTADLPDTIFDVLLHNERGEATEFSRGNVVAEIDGALLTPPLESGLLPGCLRQELLEEGTITEAVLPLEDIERAERLWFINSARGWIEVELASR